MINDGINYELLKARGFLKQKQEGFFILRTRMPKEGFYLHGQLEKLSFIAKKFGKGIVHATTRQGLEVPFVKYQDIEEVEKELKDTGIPTGTSGARLRATTCCPGNNWCKSGLINTFSLSSRIEQELGIRCGLSLPHKFKIAISGCPNTCTRAQVSEIGIHGAINPLSQNKEIGYAVYLGGCGGRTPRTGFKLDKVFSEDEVLAIIARVVKFFQKNARPRQRLALLIEEVGKENFLREII